MEKKLSQSKLEKIFEEAKQKENPCMIAIKITEEARKKQKEIDKQSSLDFQKWLESEMEGKDLSGQMPYCRFCDFGDKNTCDLPQKLRTEHCICVKSMNRMNKEN